MTFSIFCDTINAMENVLPCKDPKIIKRLCRFINEVTHDLGYNSTNVYTNGNCGNFAGFLKRGFKCAKFLGVCVEYNCDEVVCSDGIPRQAEHAEHVVSQIGAKCYDTGGEFELDYDACDYPVLHPCFVDDYMTSNFEFITPEARHAIEHAVDVYMKTPDMFR